MIISRPLLKPLIVLYFLFVSFQSLSANHFWAGNGVNKSWRNVLNWSAFQNGKLSLSVPEASTLKTM